MMNYNIIDIEASGLAIESYPIEIGILFDGQVYTWLIKPEAGWNHWDEGAEKIHGISRKKLVESGMSAKRVAVEINDLVCDGNGLLYSDAVQWDADWIQHLFRTVDVVPEFHLLPIQDLFSENQEAQFKQRRNELASTGKYRQHRAGDDVLLINDALIKVFC